MLCRRVIVSGLGLGVLVATALMGGCRTGDAAAVVGQASESWGRLEPSGPRPDGWGAVAVDIDNHAGSVVVEVEPWREEAVVEARTRWTRGASLESWDRGNVPVAAVAEFVEGPEGRTTLRVRTEPKHGAPMETHADLVLRVPNCEGLRVVNADGPVLLVGVGGAITVDNGRSSQPGGRIELRTNRALRDPMALVTTEGRVSVVVTERSRGDIDLYTADGHADLTARRGAFENVRPGRGRWRGVWNGGDNPLLVRSGRGEVRLVVTDDPERYTVADGLASVVGR